MARLTTDIDTIAKFIDLVDYPCNRDELVAYAESHNAPDELIDALEKMPEQQYQNSGEVARGLGISGSVRMS